MSDNVRLAVERSASSASHGALNYNVIFQMEELVTATFTVVIADHGNEDTNKARAIDEAKGMARQFLDYQLKQPDFTVGTGGFQTQVYPGPGRGLGSLRKP